jgi:hypothetical protein
MTEKKLSEEKNASDNPPVAKKPYLKPEFRYERAFETMALSCGKIRAMPLRRFAGSTAKARNFPACFENQKMRFRGDVLARSPATDSGAINLD